jgi:hypothetical protein
VSGSYQVRRVSARPRLRLKGSYLALRKEDQKTLKRFIFYRGLFENWVLARPRETKLNGHYLDDFIKGASGEKEIYMRVMKLITFLSTILLWTTVANIGFAEKGQTSLNLENRYICTVDTVSDLSMDFLADRIKLTISKPGAVVSTLTFSTPSEVFILKKDKTLLALKDGVTAKDSKGKTWKSRKVILDGKTVHAFFEEK